MKKDNIEDIYSELETFSKEPPKELWDNIEAKLDQRNKRGGILFLWSSIAVVLVMLFGYMIINFSDNSHQQPINEISDTEQPIDDNSANDNEANKSEQPMTKIVDESPIDNVNEDALSKNQNIKKEKLLNKSLNQNQLSDGNTVKDKEQINEDSRKQKKEQKGNRINKLIEEKNTIKGEEKSNYNKSYALNNNKVRNEGVVNSQEAVNGEKEKALVNNDSVSKAKESPIVEISETLMAEKEEEANDSTSTTDAVYKKWSIEVLGGIANTTSESSFEDVSFNTTPQNDFVYALKVGYAISDRFTIKSGIGRNILGQQIDSVSYVNSSASFVTDLAVLQFTDEGRNITDNQDILFFSSQESVIVFDEQFQDGIEVPFSKGTLRQQLNYIQVPLEVSYSLLSRPKYNVSLGVGGNVNFLSDNRAYLNDQEIGESLDVNKTIFGATLNTSISYYLTKSINLFIEPSYNYFQKPIDSNNQTFKNTQFRALFGIRYRF